MILSIQQRFILDTLRRLRCVRRQQLHILTRKNFRRSDLIISETRMEIMLQQMRNGIGDFRLEGDLVKLSAAPPDALRLEAIDVMLELTGGSPLEFEARLKAPILLHFIWGQEANTARPFTVAVLPGLEQTAAALIERYRHARVIWLSEGGSFPNGLSLPPKHFFAARTLDGSHRFYGSSEP